MRLANSHNLRWLTHAENEIAKVLRGTGSTKLTIADVKAIRSVASYGEVTHAEIAKSFGVTRRDISNIIAGKRWSHI